MYIAESLAAAQQDKRALLFELLSDGRVRVYVQGDTLPVSTTSTALEEFQAAFPTSSLHFAGPPTVAGVSAGLRVLRADRTGSKNATVAIKAFIDACIADGCDGYIPSGTYKVTPGQLVFTCGAASTPFPTIYTDGPYKTIFSVDAASSVDAPIISVVSSTAYKFWMGGGIRGGLSIVDVVSAAYSNRHGLEISGWWAPSIEHLYAENLNGNAISIPVRAVGSNPDPYSVAILRAGVIETKRCSRAVNNENGVGLTNYEIGLVRALSNRAGVMRGLGTGGVVKSFSAGDCYGWAVEDAGGPYGSLSKFTVLNAELDNCEYGIRIGNCVSFSATGFRFVHRKNFGPNSSAGYWPRIALSLAETINGNLPSVRDASVELWHRIEPGGVKADLGVFVTGNSNGNISNITVQNRVVDVASTGVAGPDVFKAFQPICISTYGYVNGTKVLSLDNNV